jgi:UDP-3-O-[3-hydroxymyristoyl] glucosamine N-acyltransferase
MIGGQVGFAGHLEIADDSKWAAQSGIHKSAPQPGGSYFGTPARGFREASKIHGAMAQLPDALNTIRQLSAEIAQLRKEIEALKAQP